MSICPYHYLKLQVMDVPNLINVYCTWITCRLSMIDNPQVELSYRISQKILSTSVIEPSPVLPPPCLPCPPCRSLPISDPENRRAHSQLTLMHTKWSNRVQLLGCKSPTFELHLVLSVPVPSNSDGMPCRPQPCTLFTLPCPPLPVSRITVILQIVTGNMSGQKDCHQS